MNYEILKQDRKFHKLIKIIPLLLFDRGESFVSPSSSNRIFLGSVRVICGFRSVGTEIAGVSLENIEANDFGISSGGLLGLIGEISFEVASS